MVELERETNKRKGAELAGRGGCTHGRGGYRHGGKTAFGGAPSRPEPPARTEARSPRARQSTGRATAPPARSGQGHRTPAPCSAAPS